MKYYDDMLIKKLNDKTYTINKDGIDIIIKPVPDDERDHVIDPRILKVIKEKEKLFAENSKKGYSLRKERHRPDKKTYDITNQQIDCEETLINVNKTHMIDVYKFSPLDNNQPKPALLYLHGGGFTAGDISLFENQMKYISEQSQSIVIFPEYRLAPETPFPGAIDDAYATLQWMHENAEKLGIDPSKIMVAGDSAGGSLTCATVLKDSQQIIKKICLIYPGCDCTDCHDHNLYTWSYDEYPAIEEHLDYTRGRINRIKNNIENKELPNLYLQDKVTPYDPLVSVVHCSDQQLLKFPDTIVVSAQYDYLRLGSDYLVKRLNQLNKDVTSICYNGCDHGFLDMIGTYVQAEDLCLLLAKELTKL